MFSNLQKRPYNPQYKGILQGYAKDSLNQVQRLSLWHTLDVHNGCVNTVVWNAGGTLLLSGSDDHNLVVSDPFGNKEIANIRTSHRSNIFSAKFLPGCSDKNIVSCAGDGTIIYTDLEKIPETRDCVFRCHNTSVYDVVTVPYESSCFLTCGEDFTVRWFDLREAKFCSKVKCGQNVLLDCGRAATALAVNPLKPFEIAVGTQDSIIRVYDRRKLSEIDISDGTYPAVVLRMRPEELKGRHQRITCLRYDEFGTHLLASYSSAYLYLFDTQTLKSERLSPQREKSSEDTEASVMRRLRLRGDWSDTGPQARPESMAGLGVPPSIGALGQARPTLQSNLMQRMSSMLTQMLSHNPPPSSQPTPPITASPPVLPTPPQAISSANVSRSSNPSSSTTANLIPTSQTPFAIPRSHIASESQITTTIESLTQSTSIGSPEGVSTSSQQAILTSSETQISTPSGSRNDESPSFSRDSSPTTARSSESDDNDSSSQRFSPVNLPTTSTSSVSAEGNVESKEKTMSKKIHESFSSLRDDFVSRHNVQPTVSLSYSEAGTSSGVITLRRPEGTFPLDIISDSDEDSSGSPPVDVQSLPLESEKSENLAADKVDNTTENVETPSSQELKNEKSDSDRLSSASLETTESCERKRRRDSGEESTDPSLDQASTTSETAEAGTSNAQDLADPASSSELSCPPESMPTASTSDDQSSQMTKKQRLQKALQEHVKKCRRETAMRVDGPQDHEVPHATLKRTYTGHRNTRTMIKEACFWGNDHVMSGSDCGRIFVWNRHTQELVMLLEADRRVVNCLQPHPTLPILASSGIDYNVKLWMPAATEEACFDAAKAAEVIQCNEVLLEETRDTITVPAAFMLRILSSLNHLRQPNPENPDPQDDSEDEI